MALGQYEYDQHQRRMMWLRILKFVLFIVFTTSVGLFSYQYAIERVKGRENKWDKDIQALSQQNAELQEYAQKFRQSAINAEAKALELEQKLQHDLPTADRATLLQAIDERLAAGVHPDRLAFVIRNASMPTHCAVTENKHLVAATTSRSHASARAAVFANGAFTLSAEGDPLRDKKGNSDGTYDTSKPVVIKITPNAREQAANGSKEQNLNGILPLTQSIMTGNREFRFTFKPGTRSYIDVTVETCEFP